VNDIDNETKILFNALSFYYNFRIFNRFKLSYWYH